jgi:methylenetetrahydrofolate--tRNA-(uracil-5-)-methyltransferase
LSPHHLTVIGGGLAGCEAAWQAARHGVEVTLYEMRTLDPAHKRLTPAHQTDLLAELVCSNSLGSNLPTRAPGLLKQELRTLGSLILRCADAAAVPAGMALAVGRETFSQSVTDAIEGHPAITVRREEATALPQEGAVVVASGPLTSDALARDIAALVGQEQLYFYDAMAPIVTLESIDQSIVFSASRWGRGDADYINCPMTQEEYERFVDALLSAERIPLEAFERQDPAIKSGGSCAFFEACLPIEVLAARGRQALAYGPLKPVGLRDPRTGQRPYAVVQLRQDNLAGTLYNLVGFQTNLRWGEQRRVFALIPGLEHAEWVRFGQMHRNTYLNAPSILDSTMQWLGNKQGDRGLLFFAGQIVGTEGYVASTASGWLAGTNAARLLLGHEPLTLPATTMIGALMRYVSSAHGADFQPMKPNFGILPALGSDAGPKAVRSKPERYVAYAERSERDLAAYLELMASPGARCRPCRDV